jgi:hypothetical protein
MGIVTSLSCAPQHHTALHITTQHKEDQMKLATCTLRSVSPYSQSRAYSHEVEKNAKETHEAYEERTWRNKSHVNPDGHIFIPPMSFKMALDAGAKMTSRRIPGKGQSTYTKFFLSGVLCMDGPVLPETKDSVAFDRIYCNANGKRGSGTRVWRTFPRIDKWEANVEFHVLADEITEEVFEDALIQAGAFVGIGRFRPENGGFFGRFEVVKIKWS